MTLFENVVALWVDQGMCDISLQLGQYHDISLWSISSVHWTFNQHRSQIVD